MISYFLTVCLIGLICPFSAHAEKATLAADSSSRRNGINFLSDQWSHPRYNSSEAMSSLALLQNQTGVNSIAVTYCWFIPDVDTPGPLTPHSSTPSNAELASLVSAAHARGISVFFSPMHRPRLVKP